MTFAADCVVFVISLQELSLFGDLSIFKLKNWVIRVLKTVLPVCRLLKVGILEAKLLKDDSASAFTFSTTSKLRKLLKLRKCQNIRLNFRSIKSTNHKKFFKTSQNMPKGELSYLNKFLQEISDVSEMYYIQKCCKKETSIAQFAFNLMYVHQHKRLSFML